MALNSHRKLVNVGDRQQEISKYEYRELSLNRSSVDESSRIVEFSCSSEYPVERWWGREILEHTSDAVDLTRLNNGANLLYGHDSSDYIGVIERSWLSGKRLYCRARFDSHEKADKVFKSVADGILRNVSIGYSIESMREENGSYRVTKWMPYEISIVTVPADPTVGVGRSLTNIQISKTMTTTPELTERERIQSIINLCRKYQQNKQTEEYLINNGISIEESRTYILNQLNGRQQQPIASPVHPLGLTEKEKQRYSLRNVILALATKDFRSIGYEIELSEQIAKDTKRSSAGLFVPMSDLNFRINNNNLGYLERATYNVGTPTQGGNLVETVLDSANFIEFLRNRQMTRRLGARSLSGLQGNVDIPRQVSTAGAYWLSAEGSNVVKAEGTFDKVSLSPKTIGVKSRFTRQMLLQSSLDIELLIRSDLADAIAVEIDRAAVHGSGTGGEPLGLLNMSGVPSVPLGTNGGALTWDAILRLEELPAVANADTGALGYLTNPKVRRIAKQLVKNSQGTNSDFIWEAGALPNEPWIGRINGYIAGATNQMPSNLTKGTGSNLSSILYGDWSQLLYGEWSITEILLNPYGAGFDSGDVEVRALHSLDIAVRRPTAFAKITDCVTV